MGNRRPDWQYKEHPSIKGRIEPLPKVEIKPEPHNPQEIKVNKKEVK